MYRLPYEWWTILKKSLSITSRKESLTYHIFDSWIAITLDSDYLHLFKNSVSYFPLFYSKDFWWMVSKSANRKISLRDVWSFNMCLLIHLLSIYPSVRYSFEILNCFFSHFLCFSYCFPFFRNVGTSKEYARVGEEPLCIKRLLGRSNS